MESARKRRRERKRERVKVRVVRGVGRHVQPENN